MPRLAPVSTSVLATIAIAASAAAQCATQWLPGMPLPGTNGIVRTVVEWDPDGSGPATPLVVAGGAFTAAGAVAANRIAAWDPATGTWSPLGTGLDAEVHALAVLPSGELVAAGAFTTAGGVAASYVARWNGTAWTPLGFGLSSTVQALAVMPNGDLVAGGTSQVARWNGTAWTPLGGITGSVRAAAAMPNGDLVVAGTFVSPALGIARWNGSSWSALGSGLSGHVHSLRVLPNGDLIAGGPFNVQFGAPGNYVARWNGTVWSPLANGTPTTVDAMTTLPNGDLVAVGANIAVSRWDGTAWSVITPVVDDYHAVATLANGTLVAAGRFPSIGGVFAENIGAWNGATWSALGASSPGPVWTTAIAFAPNGDLIAAGLFRTLGLVNAYRVARRSGSTWSVLGGDFDTVVRDLAVLPSGDVVACGQFTSIGGVPMARVARWNGTSWAGLGTGMNHHVYALEVLPNGDLVAGGWFNSAGGVAANRVARWNGSAWAPMGAGIAGPYVHALAVLPGGDVVAGGQLAVGNLDFHVARWDGVAWTQLGTLSGNVKALVAMANGDVVAGGTFTGSGSVPLLRVARWNGSAWSALGSGIGEWFSGDSVDALAALPDGDVVAAGYFDTIGAVPAAGIARWSGTAWSPLATFASGLSSTGVIETLATPPGGGLVAGGLLTRLDDAVAVGVVELGTTCPASAIASGAGCSGSGGPNVLTATSLPWVGGTFASIATGMPANGLALDVLGLATTSVPLVAILPQGMPGCTLRVAPDLVRVVMPAGGAAATTLLIPSSAALVGTVLHQQVAAIEVDAAGAFVAVTSTNALTLTIGRF